MKQNVLWFLHEIDVKCWIHTFQWFLISSNLTFCSPCHSFLFRLLFARTWHFMSNSAGVSRKADVYSTGAPGPCSRFLHDPGLLIYFCFYERVILTIHVLCAKRLFSSLNYVLTFLYIFLILVPLQNTTNIGYGEYAKETTILPGWKMSAQA